MGVPRAGLALILLLPRVADLFVSRPLSLSFSPSSGRAFAGVGGGSDLGRAPRGCVVGRLLGGLKA